MSAARRQTASQQAVVQRVRRAPVGVPVDRKPDVVTYASFDSPSDEFWANGPTTSLPSRAQPFPHTDLRRLQLLGMIDAMVQSTPPPPMYALYEVLSLLERFHAGSAAGPDARTKASFGATESAYAGARVPATQPAATKRSVTVVTPAAAAPSWGGATRPGTPGARPQTRGGSRRVASASGPGFGL